MLASVKETGWLGIVTVVRGRVDAETQREAGAPRARASGKANRAVVK